jgi:fibronectin type 3 domain-containing protein
MGRILAVLVVLLLCLGPMVQAIDVGVVEGISTVETDGVLIIEPVSPDAEKLLSDIDGFFTENKGQKGEGAGRFYCEGSPLSVAFGAGWVAYDLRGEGDEGVMFRMNYEGANSIVPIGVDPLPHSNNYFIGNDPDDWVTGAMNYREILLPSLYNGIDLRFYFQQGQLKYDFIVLPWADPSAIQLNYEGIETLVLDEMSGDLLITTAVGTVRDLAPWTYQKGPNGPVDVLSSFQLEDGNTITILVGPYDEDRSLVIDPGLTFSTYLGGTLYDGAGSVALSVDDDGDVYITGTTRSVNFPITTGAYDTTHNGGDWDLSVSKLVSNGTELSYSTYIGGSSGEYTTDITIDEDGRVFVTGNTGSTDFPVSSNAYQRSPNSSDDGFVFKLDTTGQAIVYSTYFGGSDYDYIEAIDIDGQGKAYVVGNTKSNDFPVISGCFDTVYNGGGDGFVALLNGNGTKVIYGTYVGGSGSETLNSVDVDDNGDVYAAGFTGRNDFPTTLSAFDRTHNGQWDGCVLKMPGNLSSLVFSTFLGGNSFDRIRDIIVDDDGNVIVGGETQSPNFPITQGAYDTTLGGLECFVAKLKARGDELVVSTFFGGSKDESMYGVATDANGTIFIIGETDSTDYPTTLNAYSKKGAGNDDAYIARLDPNGTELEYSTYLGGSDYEWNAYGGAIHVGRHGTTVAGKTDSLDYPTTPGAYSGGNSGGFDMFITRLPTPRLNETRPSPPVNLSAVAGDRMVTLTWDPPMDDGGYPVLSYTVYQGVNETVMAPIRVLGSVDRSYNDTGREGWTAYYYGVTAQNLVGMSEVSIIVNATPAGPPSTPQNLTATPGPSRIRLSWTAPLVTGDVPLLGYRLFRSDSQFERGQQVYEGPDENYTDEGLENGRIYNFRLCAFNMYDNGTLTVPVSMAPAGPPSEPLYLKAKASDGRVDLTWRAPQFKWGIQLLGYNLHRGSSEDTLVTYLTLMDEFATSYEDVDLDNGETYFYAVQVFNIYGNSSLSNIVNATPFGLPGAPTNLSAIGSDGKVTLTWEVPGIDGGAPIMGYSIHRGLDPDGMTMFIQVDSTSHIDTGLLNGETYYFQVRAYTDEGEGPLSEIVFVTPHALPEAPGDFVIEEGHGWLKLMWIRPRDDGGAPIEGYNIYRGDSLDSMELVHVGKPRETSYRDEDVVIGTTHHYEVTAYTQFGEGPPSGVSSGMSYGLPGLPTDFTVEPGNGEVALFWDVPDDDGASIIVGYVIMRGTTAASLRELAQLGDIFSYLDTTVTNDQTYLYAIAAINEAGPGQYTDTLEAMPFKAATPPGKVMTLNIGAKGNSVVLQWTTPLDDGGSPLTGYLILRGTSPGSLGQVAEVEPGVHSHTDGDLKRGTTYYYSVVAKNAVGDGEPIAAREVKIIPPKGEESPGFEVVARHRSSCS